MAYTSYDDRVPQLGDVEMITARNPDADLVKVFLHKSEKDLLKETAAKQGIPVSHLMRSLALQWLDQQIKLSRATESRSSQPPKQRKKS